MIDDARLYELERIACSGDTPLHAICAELVNEVRGLRHELNDPRYLYSGRINRQALISRNEEIDMLRSKLDKLATQLKEKGLA